MLFEGCRGPIATPASSRRQHTKQALQLLGTIIMMFKLMLFADLLAGMGRGDVPVLQSVLLLIVTIAYWVYVRMVAPFTALVEVLVEIVAAACDTMTFLLAFIASLTPAGSFNLL